MGDVESLGLGDRCVILSAAFVPFEMSTGKIFEDAIFYERIDWQHALNEGFKSKQSTMDFWNKQPKHIRDREFGGVDTIKQFCDKMTFYFDKTIRKRWKTFNVWSTALKLDFGGLYSYYEHIGEKFPIPYTSERCARTIRSMTKDVCPLHISNDFDHNPVNDCKTQIMELTEQFKHIQII